MGEKNLAEIVKAAQHGDKSAFKELFNIYHKQIYWHAFRIMSQNQDAKDVCQEVFLTVFSQLKSLKSPETFRPWMYKTTSNKCSDVFRKRGRMFTEELPEFKEPEIFEKPAPCQSPDKKLDNDETKRMIAEIIGTLVSDGFNNFPVVAINNTWQSVKYTLESVIIPENVEYIGRGAFCNCQVEMSHLRQIILSRL